MSDHERIWLQNADDARATGDRLWCQDKVWPECDEQQEPTEYIRADLYASRISQQDAELERLRRELGAERESVADLAAETQRLTDAMIASRLDASEAREKLASARAALWKIAGETYDDSSEKIARAALVKTEETRT